VLHDRAQHWVFNRILSPNQVRHDVEAAVASRKQCHGAKVWTLHAVNAVPASCGAPFQDFLGF
jgi:hypothetical protein